MKESPKWAQQALEEAVSRALRDNLTPLQRTAEELQQAYADLIAACSSSRPTNALPAMLRAQTAAASLAAGLAVLSNFVTLALQPRESQAEQAAAEPVPAAGVAVESGVEPAVPSIVTEEISAPLEKFSDSGLSSRVAELPAETPVEPPPAEEAAAFDIRDLPREEQEMHRRANRVAKVAMQDIHMLRPADVRLGREHRDICLRLRSELDKARKEYDRRFKLILDHPVDYFHFWMVQILAGGDPEALGEYPYPSSVHHT